MACATTRSSPKIDQIQSTIYQIQSKIDQIQSKIDQIRPRNVVGFILKREWFHARNRGCSEWHTPSVRLRRQSDQSGVETERGNRGKTEGKQGENRGKTEGQQREKRGKREGQQREKRGKRVKTDRRRPARGTARAPPRPRPFHENRYFCWRKLENFSIYNIPNR